MLAVEIVFNVIANVALHAALILDIKAVRNETIFVVR